MEVFPERPHLTRESAAFQAWRAGTRPKGITYSPLNVRP